MKEVKRFEFIDHGLDYPDYFPGYGTALTGYDYAFVGAGTSISDAFEDALELAAQSDIGGLEKIEAAFKSEIVKEMSADELALTEVEIGEDDDFFFGPFYYFGFYVGITE